jgi:hypothetical protein
MVYLAIFVVPNLSAVYAAAERHHAQKAKAENEAFCTKLHFGSGAAMAKRES